ncbi:hypothetical protein BDQ17DRAFT_1543049 [Cyathus striatus]|nr:hypothetical protein BDQ17DRAFT_1543049 [Cyathus striatus]
MLASLPSTGFPSASHRQAILERIDRKQSRIFLLRKEIDALARDIECDRFFIATHRKLPPEILGEIFSYAATHGHAKWIAPFILSHVSRRWRQVAHRTSLVWSYPCISIMQDSGSSQLTKIWLERSGSCPLYLRFETTDRNASTREGMRKDLLAELFAFLRPHADRWLSVNICIDSYHSIWNVQALIQQFNFPMPMLQNFSLDTARNMWQDYCVLRDAVPQLRQLTIGHCRPSVHNHWLPQLQELIITQATHCIFYIHRLLQVCTGLRTLTLDANIPERELPSGLPPVSLHSLEFLRLNDLKYMPYLRVPTLTTLEIRKNKLVGPHEAFMLITSLRMMLLVSENSTLRELTLDNVDIGHITLSAMKDLPSLEVITMKNCPVTDQSLRILEDSTICPRLHALNFFACDMLNSSIASVGKARNAASASATRVQRMMLFDCLSVSGHTINELRDCDHPLQICWVPSTRSTAIIEENAT